MPGCFFFITICCRSRGTNQLCGPTVAPFLFNTVCFRHERGDWFAQLFLLMPDHLHAILAIPPEHGMEETISNWKQYAARHTGISWQRDFFDHRLRNDESLEEKMDYIRMNPVRRGLAAKPQAWPWVWEP
jgi:putative transposase